jgi:hypothetical protein
MRKFPEQRAPEDRFSTHVRHYHRKGTPKRTWDEWVDGGAKPDSNPLLWLKWLGIALALMVLAGIGIALYIEMR